MTSPRGLPLEILFQIVETVRSRTKHECIEDFSNPQTDLKNISLASRALRAVGQPALFHRIELTDHWDLQACLFRAHKLEKMFCDRQESPGWVRRIMLTWSPPPEQDVEAHREAMNIHKELCETVSRVFTKLF